MQKLTANKKYLFFGLLALLFALIIFVAIRAVPKEITISEYETMLSQNLISDAVLDENRVLLSVGHSRYYVLKDSIDMRELGKRVAISVKSGFSTELTLFIGLVLGLFFYSLYSRRKKPATYQTSTELSSLVGAEAITPTISNVLFKDVAGIDEVKSELMEIVDFLKNPRKYREFGVKLPRGVLMIGPPGVGKTLVAKAVAGEAGVPFFYQSGASFVQIYVGMGAKRVRELFAKAKSFAPSIIFIDEIDAVGKARGGGRNDEREATLNQLLTEMDGFNDSSGIIVIAATNKIEMIDEALLRSGRFDRRVFLALPDLNDRKDILKSYLASKKHEVDIDTLARHTTGFSGAGLATLVNEAAINAIREKRVLISDDDFKAVFSKVLHGKRKIGALNEAEKQLQALYKAAKALSAEWFGVEFERISLLEERFIDYDHEIKSKSEIIAKIKVLLAGREAMKIYQNELYSNCASDVALARELAHKAVSEYAMSKNLLASEVDVLEILESAQAQVAEFISNMQAQLEAISEFLAQNESISRAEVANIIKARYEQH
ncbi:MAG: ATP-dependent metallopeptidase FtsH/Yme1/Tma family protein [Campylobacter sp.]|nr:ATP-dependent metallopeptidase FtsH/Yme1/Tma family protein [Campylobacter sp.]MCI7549044.1 ATP-dependent metallopeptidase FtsH/Yme1/Tma family protein [Campylobacter sp.]